MTTKIKKLAQLIMLVTLLAGAVAPLYPNANAMLIHNQTNTDVAGECGGGDGCSLARISF